MKRKKIKLCAEESHDWEAVGKVKDALGKHPCEYYPDGCNTCMDRFTCFTKESPDMYRSRYTGTFYACKKCPAVSFKGTIKEWTEKPRTAILDCRVHTFVIMSNELAVKLRNKWI